MNEGVITYYFNPQSYYINEDEFYLSIEGDVAWSDESIYKVSLINKFKKKYLC